MNILIISQRFYPEEFNINDITEELVKRGHEVTVLTGLPNYPSGIIPKEYKLFKNRTQNYNGAKVIRTFEIARKNSKLGLSLNYLSFMFSSMVRSLFMKKNFDIIYVYQLTPVTMALPGVLLRKLTNKKLFLHCLDLWPESLKTMLSENSKVFKIMDKISNFIYKRADKIAITSRPFSKYFVEHHHIEEERIIYIPQHSNEVLDELILSKNESDTTNFVFTGNIGKAQGLDVFIYAAEIIKDTDFHIHFVGAGSDLDRLKNKVNEKKLSNKITFHGRKDKSDMPYYYNLADVCLISLKSDSIIGETLPAKLQGYFAAGKPVLGSIGGAAAEEIKASSAGIVVEYDNIEELSSAMKKFIYLDRSELQKMSINAKKYFNENFTKEIIVDKLEQALYDLEKGL